MLRLIVCLDSISGGLAPVKAMNNEGIQGLDASIKTFHKVFIKKIPLPGKGIFYYTILCL
jgi:hypothetical protein